MPGDLRRAWVGIIIIGALARAALVAARSEGVVLQELEPSVIARHLNAGDGFIFEQYGAVYRAWKEPLFIVLLAGVMRVAGPHEHLAILLWQSVWGIGTALGVMLLARAVLRDRTAAFLAGGLAAINPFLVYYDTSYVHPLSFDMCLWVFSTWGVIAAAQAEQGGLRPAMRAGGILGVAIWQRATVFAAAAAAWAAALVCAPRGERQRVGKRAAIGLGLAGLLFLPWIVRNAMVVGRPVITTDAAHILWLGNNPWSNGTYSDAEGRRIIHRADPELLARLRGASELEQSDLFLREVARFVREQPARAASLVLRRVWSFVWFSPNAGLLYTEAQQRLYRAAYAGLLLLGGAGFLRYWRRASGEDRAKALMVLASVGGIAAVHAATAINLKHRVPLELVLSVFAAEALARRRT